MKVKTVLSQAKSRRGFTLVEMLVVIGMIAALSGISFPVYKSIQKKVEKQQIAMMYSALNQAVENFETEYNYLPYAEAAYPNPEGWYRASQNLATPLTSALAGVGNNCNFKKIKFFEWDEPKGDAPGNYRDGLFVDIDGGTATLYTPWGGEWDTYALDHDMDGQIAYGLGGGTQAMKGKIIIWDRGADETWGSGDEYSNFDELLP